MNRQLEILGTDDEVAASYNGVGPSTYVPILKLKLGEREALRTLRPEQQHRLVPVIEAVPGEETQPGQAVEDLMRELRKAWAGRVFLLDLGLLSADVETVAFEAVADYGLPAVPIVASDRGADAVARLGQASQKLGLGVAIRLKADSSLSPDKHWERVAEILHRVGHGRNRADLIVDYGSLDRDGFLRVSRHVRQLLAALPEPEAWRSLVLSSSAFPPNLAGIEPYQRKLIERLDWKLWRQFVATEPARVPSYSDYTIANPALPEPGRQAPRSLRYATEEDWVILKGAKPQKGIADTRFIELFEDFATSRDYSGDRLSWGDEYIHACARQGMIKGNASTWRQVGVSHHIGLVLTQLEGALRLARTRSNSS